MALTLVKWALASAAIVTPGGVPAAGGQLVPASVWVVNYGETQCTAQRTFGQGDRALTLALSPALDGASYEIIISEADGPAQLPEQIMGKANFGDRSVKSWALRYRDPASGSQVHRFQVPANLVAVTAASGDIAFGASAYRAHFQNTNLVGALSALDTCLKDLRTYWNAASSARSTAASARDNVEALLRPANHVDSDMWGGVKGTARYVLYIDPAGRLAGCDAMSADASPILGVLGCDILRQRGQFAPALDKDGKPVRDVIVTSQVRWKFG
ncbi:MAG: hypothetical protein ABIS23_00010 [Sphingomicrobium sp.]